MDESGASEVRQVEMGEAGDAGSIRDIAGRRFCWLTGLTKGTRPKNWYGDWWLQVAHISSGSGAMHRVNDRRAVVLLCPLAHECHVHDRVAIPTKHINGREYPTIDAANLMWIKQIMDHAYYDRDYLRHIWTGMPPEPARPSNFWLNMLFENTGMSL
jgi:hypothetical protein